MPPHLYDKGVRKMNRDDEGWKNQDVQLFLERQVYSPVHPSPF